jgi:hypothetical protein
MWLWSDLDHVAFDISDRLSSHVRYDDDEQFTPEARTLAFLASERVTQYRESFPTPESAAQYLMSGADTPSNAHSAGLAYALCGDVGSSHRQLTEFARTEATLDWQIKQRDEAILLSEISDPALLKAAVTERIGACRVALKLPI